MFLRKKKMLTKNLRRKKKSFFWLGLKGSNGAAESIHKKTKQISSPAVVVFKNFNTIRSYFQFDLL